MEHYRLVSAETIGPHNTYVGQILIKSSNRTGELMPFVVSRICDD